MQKLNIGHQKALLDLWKLKTMNWPVLIIFGILAVGLIVFLVVRNQKDAKELEEEIKHDYRKPRDDKGDIEIDEVMK